MLIGIKGLTGHGKTLFMTLLAYYIRQIWKDCNVYANYDLLLDGVERMEYLEDLENANEGVVCIDEGGVIFDSRGFSRWENNSATQWLVQTRHAGLIVMTTMQIMSQLDKRFRECMDYLIQCKKENGIFTATIVDMASGKILCHWRVPRPDLVWKLYNTRSERVIALKSKKQAPQGYTKYGGRRN